MRQYTNRLLRACKSQVREYSWKMLIMVDIKGPFVLIHHVQYPVKVGSHIQTSENSVETSAADCQGSCTSYCIANSLGIMWLNIPVIMIILTSRAECGCVTADLLEIAFLFAHSCWRATPLHMHAVQRSFLEYFSSTSGC